MILKRLLSGLKNRLLLLGNPSFFSTSIWLKLVYSSIVGYMIISSIFLDPNQLICYTYVHSGKTHTLKMSKNK